MSKYNPLTLEKRVEAFIQLGELLEQAVVALTDTSFGEGIKDAPFLDIRDSLLQSEKSNPWFTREHLIYSLHNLSSSLQRPKVESWLSSYQLGDIHGTRTDLPPIGRQEMKTVGVVLAGNIPFVGFHDYLCVLISGHRFAGKLSSEDPMLMPLINRLLIGINPAFNDLVAFQPDKLTGFDAIIATGSNNTNRYFEYYFGKYPHIFRRNRNSVALITGNETQQQLEALADDIFLYFGKGCRSVSKLFLPVDYNVDGLINACKKYSHYLHHNKFRNNYDYNKAVYQMGSSAYWDCDFFILKEEAALSSPVSIVNFQSYDDTDNVVKLLTQLADQIQCVVSVTNFLPGVITPGQAQRTELWDYADRIDTMEFLMKL
jgi:hypothetical protein